MIIGPSRQCIKYWCFLLHVRSFSPAVGVRSTNSASAGKVRLHRGQKNEFTALGLLVTKGVVRQMGQTAERTGGLLGFWGGGWG